MKKSIALLSTLALTACATMSTGKTQEVSVISTPSGAKCTAKNDKGAWQLTTPQSVVVARSKQPLVITCNKGGLKGSRSVEGKTKEGFDNNILLGGTVGMIVDHDTGAAFSYLPEIHVGLK